jgi:hypothetical protein
MTSLVLAARQATASNPPFAAHLQSLPGGLEILVGPVSVEAAGALDRELARIGPDVLSSEVDILADCGRLVPGAPGQKDIVARADVLLFLLRPDVAGLAHAHGVFSRLACLAPSRHYVVMVGGGSFDIGEVREVLGAEVIAVVAHDPQAAAMACGEPGRSKTFARSRLVGSVRALVGAVLTAAAPVPSASPPIRRAPGPEPGVSPPLDGGPDDQELVGCHGASRRERPRPHDPS